MHKKAKKASTKTIVHPHQTGNIYTGIDEILVHMKKKAGTSSKTEPVSIRMPDASECEPVLINAKVEFSLRAEPLGKESNISGVLKMAGKEQSCISASAEASQNSSETASKVAQEDMVIFELVPAGTSLLQGDILFLCPYLYPIKIDMDTTKKEGQREHKIWTQEWN